MGAPSSKPALSASRAHVMRVTSIHCSHPRPQTPDCLPASERFVFPSPTISVSFFPPPPPASHPLFPRPRHPHLLFTHEVLYARSRDGWPLARIVSSCRRSFVVFHMPSAGIVCPKHPSPRDQTRSLLSSCRFSFLRLQTIDLVPGVASSSLAPRAVQRATRLAARARARRSPRVPRGSRHLARA